jgi:histone deacetylase 6
MSESLSNIDIKPAKKFGYIYDVRMMNHKGPISHPEAPERIEAIYNELLSAGLLKDAVHIPAREVTHEELLRCHDPRFLKSIKNKMIHQTLQGGDMFTSAGTYLAAKLAAGSAIELADAILTGKIENGFAIVRPPHHHAGCGRCGGFCFYNGTMLAATHLTNAGKKVYVVDFDLHFADGSVNIIKSALHRDNQLIHLFSIHRWDNGMFYPGGKEGFTGYKAGGRVSLVGYEGYQGDEFYLQTCMDYMLPHMKSFQPDIVIVSAGFDAALGDPMAAAGVTTAGYRAIMELILSACPKVGMVLEGGYGLVSTPKCAAASVKALLASNCSTSISS